MRAINLKTNHLTAPVGIDAGPLFLSWQCADGVRQTAYEIQLTANGEMIWHSGKTEGAAMHADVPAVGGSRVSGYWRVRLWDENDVPGAWSEARFETGLAQCDWAQAGRKRSRGQGCSRVVQAPSSGIVPAQKLHGVQGRGMAVYHGQGIVRGMAERCTRW